MAKPKKKLTSKQRAQKRAPREEAIEALSAEQFIMANTDPIWLHQHEMWEYIDLREQPALDSEELEQPIEQNKK